MSDDDTPGIAPDPQAPDLLLYDFLKFLTTLAILILGGVLTLASGTQHVSKIQLALVITLLGLAGAIALTGADAVITARGKNRPVAGYWRWSRNASMGLLGTGTGIFLSMWSQGLL